MRSIYLYDGFNRFWHWTQAALILLLAATGFEIHGSYAFFGYAVAVKAHVAGAMAFLVLVAFALFWHLSTGAWRQYLPTREHLRAQIEYYLTGIFRNAPHPTRKTTLSKLNPLQRLVYAGLKLLVIPVVALSGLLYLFYRTPQRFEVQALKIESLRGIALVHTLGAFLLLAFLLAHLYLITTGRTLTSNLRAMLTGYEEVEDEEEKEKEK